MGNYRTKTSKLIVVTYALTFFQCNPRFNNPVNLNRVIAMIDEEAWSVNSAICPFKLRKDKQNNQMKGVR